MNVGLYLTNFDPCSGGGFTYAEAALEAIRENLSGCRHTFTVFVESGNSEDWSVFPGSHALRYVSVPGSVKRSFTQRVFSRLRRELFRNGARKEPTALEILQQELGVEVMIFLANHPGGALLDTPFLFVVWDLQHRLQPWFPEVSEHGTWQNREEYYGTVLRRASIVITGTRAGAEEIKDFYQVPDFRIKVVPFPVPTFSECRPTSKSRDVFSAFGIASPYLFYPAQYWPHKNHCNLLLALKKLRAEHKLPLDVVFVGSDKGNLDHLKNFTETLGLKPHVHFLGFVSRAELRALYENAFALSFVTFFGPDNLPPLEAFALGCPVVASAVSGSSEQLGDAALLVDPKDPEDIAGAVKRLWEDKSLCATLVEKGRQRVDSWTKTDFCNALFNTLDEFETIRRCWS